MSSLPSPLSAPRLDLPLGRVRSVKRPGGKSRLLPVLLPLIAERPHTCYCEPFAGSFTVGFNKPRSKTNVLNDSDLTLINAMRQIKHHPESLLRELEGRVNSRHEMMLHRNLPPEHLTEIQRAAAWLHDVMISFGADGWTFGVQRASGGGASARLTSLPEKIKTLHRVLDGVNIECLPWERCTALYDSAATLFFFDPPYTTGKISSYAPFTAAHMDALRDVLPGLAGQWILTVDDTPANRTRFGAWLVAEKSSQSGTRNQSSAAGAQFREIICASPLR